MAKVTTKEKEEMIQIPRAVFAKFVEFEEALEDWFMNQDEELLKELRQAKRDADEGKFIPWEQVKRRLHIA